MSPSNKNLFNIQKQFFDVLVSASSDFQNAIDPIGDMTAHDCVGIYRRGYKARLIEVLGDTFESCWWVLGDELFFEIAGHYIDNHPSQVFDLDQYGDKFPDYLEEIRQRHEINEEFNFLKDLARFEWIFKTVFHQKNPSSSQVNWKEVLSGESTVKLRLSSSSDLLESGKNIYEIWKLRKGPQKPLSEVNFDQPVKLLIYKFESKVFVKDLSELEYLALKHVRETGEVSKLFDLILAKRPQTSANEVSALFRFLQSLSIIETQSI